MTLYSYAYGRGKIACVCILLQCLSAKSVSVCVHVCECVCVCVCVRLDLYDNHSNIYTIDLTINVRKHTQTSTYCRLSSGTGRGSLALAQGGVV